MSIFGKLFGNGSNQSKADNFKSWEEENTYHGETPPCPRCGQPLTKRYVFSGMYCLNCNYGLDDDDDEEESGVTYCDVCEHSDEYPNCKWKCPYDDE